MSWGWSGSSGSADSWGNEAAGYGWHGNAQSWADSGSLTSDIRCAKEGERLRNYTYLGGKKPKSLPKAKRMAILYEITGGKLPWTFLTAQTSESVDVLLFLLAAVGPSTHIAGLSSRMHSLTQSLKESFYSRFPSTHGRAIYLQHLKTTSPEQLEVDAMADGFTPNDSKSHKGIETRLRTGQAAFQFPEAHLKAQRVPRQPMESDFPANLAAAMQQDTPVTINADSGSTTSVPLAATPEQQGVAMREGPNNPKEWKQQQAVNCQSEQKALHSHNCLLVASGSSAPMTPVPAEPVGAKTASVLKPSGSQPSKQHALAMAKLMEARAAAAAITAAAEAQIASAQEEFALAA